MVLAVVTAAIFAAASVLTITLADSGQASPNGPLGDASTAGQARVCVPVDPSGPTVTFPVVTFAVPKAVEPLRITSIRLVHATGIRVIDAQLVAHGYEAVGYYDHYPPDYAAIAGTDWMHRQPAIGTVPAPTSGHRRYDIVLGLRSPNGGRFPYATIGYTSHGKSYVLLTTTGGLLLKPPGKC